MRAYLSAPLPCSVLLCIATLLVLASDRTAAAPIDPVSTAATSYILIGWNDLGMHCSNKRYADIAVLPPYNTVWAQMVRVGNRSTLPALVGAPNTATYSIEGNTYSVGKTDFWSYETPLFGVSLPDNVGLHGKGLTGSLDWNTDHFEAIGIPITPYTDADLVHEQPYQLGLLKAYDASASLLATTEIVTPVSNEMMCSDCHVPLTGETVEMAILRRHDAENGTALLSQRPVLCAKCHASNALGMPGLPGLPSLSQAMHQQHAEQTNNCYKCHPGPNTQCLRDVMSQQHSMTCQNCHGSVLNVATTIEQGRQPWLQEPRCGTCHGAAYSESPNTLYRNSKGHGGLYCEACHNSPHAILPTREERDNRQVVRLQSFAGTLKRCDVCHGYVPWAPGPHGLYPTGVEEPTTASALGPMLRVAPNPAVTSAEIHYRAMDNRPVRLAVYDVRGRLVKLLTTRAQTPGDHALVWDGTGSNGARVAPGVYLCRLESGGTQVTTRLVLEARQ
jgi:hypothetical protein